MDHTQTQICNSCLVLRVFHPAPVSILPHIFSSLVLIWHSTAPTARSNLCWALIGLLSINHTFPTQAHSERHVIGGFKSDEREWPPSTPPCIRAGNSNHWAKWNNRCYIISVNMAHKHCGYLHNITILLVSSEPFKKPPVPTVQPGFFVVVLLSSGCAGHVASPVSSHSAWRAYSGAGARTRSHHPPSRPWPHLNWDVINLLAEWKRVFLNRSALTLVDFINSFV